jgi:DNA-binding HxlR family transcriptional regulator
MRSYGQYCPISIAAEVLGDRWTLLIVREMIGGATRFNQLERLLPNISRSILSQRLRHLARVQIIDAIPLPSGRGHEYQLTEAGRELLPVLMSMGEWSVRWLFRDPEPDELDPHYLMWWMQHRVNVDELPPGRTVVRYDILGDGRDVYWLVLQIDEVSLCQQDPGFPVDLHITADSTALHRVFAGRITLADALGDETISIDGPSTLVRCLPQWFAWSPLYEAARAEAAR